MCIARYAHDTDMWFSPNTLVGESKPMALYHNYLSVTAQSLWPVSVTKLLGGSYGGIVGEILSYNYFQYP